MNNLLAAYSDKSAYAQCIFAFSPGPGIEPKTFVGRTYGKIVPARGPPDFGYQTILGSHLYFNSIEFKQMGSDLSTRWI